MTLGQRIVQIRTEHSLSQESFAEKLGTTRQTVSRWELDQTYPTLDHIVRISRIFSVTTDSILRDGISTFDEETPYFSCGVFRGRDCEIVETERFALKLYHSADKTRLGAVLYRGFEQSKRLTAICEYDLTTQTTEYAYLVDGCEPHTAVCNSERMAEQLTAPYNPDETRPLRRLEAFSVDREHTPRPTVREAGIPGCLNAWRMGDSYTADHDRMHFLLCTGKTSYVFTIDFQDTNIYCGASYDLAFDLGLFGGPQFFRIRNYRDNSEPFCGFHADFTCTCPELRIPTEQCVLGQYISTREGLMWCVKRYTDDEIVLQGCGEDEYIYRRDDAKTERFVVDKSGECG